MVKFNIANWEERLKPFEHLGYSHSETLNNFGYSYLPTKYLNISEFITNEASKRDFLYQITEQSGNYYRLLAHMSSCLPDGAIVFDVGTYLGTSALALSYNQHVSVISYDVANYRSAIKPENVTFKIGNFLEDADLLNAAMMFIDVDPHDGHQETVFLKHLIKVGYKGILLFDDIHLNQGMEMFWRECLSYGAKDLTSLGHATGTGMLIL